MPLLSLSFVLAQLTSPQIPQKPDGAKVMATVNGAPITAAEVEPYLWDWRSDEVVQDLVTLRIMEQAAAKAGVSVTPEEVQANIKKQLSQLQGGTFDEAKLRAQGFPMSRLTVRLTGAMLLDKIVLKDFKAADWVRVSGLTFKAAGKALVQIGASAHKAEVVYSQLKGGTTWQKLSKSGEESPSTWAPLTALPPGSDKTLAAGVLLPPYPNDSGVVITRVDALGASASPAELETLKADYLSKNREAIMEKIRQEAKVEKKP